MFTEQDYKEYFDQIASLERLMVYRLYEVLFVVEDQAIWRALEEIGRDERRHYGYIREIFDSILFQNEKEKRRHAREHVLGKAWIKVLDGQDQGAIFEGYCVDISKSGACLEFDRFMPFHGDAELQIKPYGDGEAQRHVGRLIWSVLINPSLQMGSIQFKVGMKFD